MSLQWKIFNQNHTLIPFLLMTWCAMIIVSLLQTDLNGQIPLAIWDHTMLLATPKTSEHGHCTVNAANDTVFVAEFYNNCRGGLAATPPLPGIDTVAAAHVRGRASRLAPRIDVTSRRLSKRRELNERDNRQQTCS